MVRNHQLVWACIYILLALSLSKCSAQQPVMRIAVIAHGDWRDPSDVFSNPMNYPVLNLQTYLRGISLWENGINDYGGIPTYDGLDTRVRVQVSYFNIGNSTSTTRATSLVAKFANRTYGHFPVIISPGFTLDTIVTVFLSHCEITQACLTVLPLTPSSSVFQCTAPLPPDCRRAGARRFQYGFSVLYDGNFALSAHLSLFRQNSISNIAVLYSSLPYGTLASATTQDTAFGLGLNVVDTRMFDATVPWSPAVAESLVALWQQLDVQGLCVLSNGADAVALDSLVTMMGSFKSMNWLPSAIALGGSIGSNLATKLGNDDFAYMLTAAQWDWHLKGRQFSTINSTFNLELFPASSSSASPSVFRDAMIKAWGPTSDANLVYANDAVQALTFIQKFIEGGNGAWDVESMRAASRQVSTPSINGQLQIDAYGRTVVSDQLVFQALPNGSRLINSPLSIGVPVVIPMPKWNEREFHGAFFDTSVEQAAIALNSILFVYSTLLVLGFILFRKHTVMKAATPLFCILMVVGGQLMQASIYATSLYQTTASCHAQFWLLTTGFSLMFGALFMKTWRVVKIFNAGKKLRKVAISNSMLLAGLGGLMSFDIILNTIASAAGLFHNDYVIVDEFRPSLNYYECAVDDGARIYLVITAAEKGVLILAGIVLTIAARNVPSRFNETPYLATAIYNCALLCAFAVAMVATGIGGRDVSYAVQVFGIEVLIVSTLSIVFLPKFYLMFGNSKRLKELEKLNEQFTNTESVGSKPGWNRNKPAVQNGTAAHTKNSSIHPQPTNTQTTQTDKSQPIPTPAGTPPPGQRSSFAHSSRMTIMRGPQNSHAHEAVPQANSIHPFSISTELIDVHNSDEFLSLIPNATTATLLSHSAQLNARLESITSMLQRMQSELERRQSKETIAPVARLATSSSTAAVETSVSEVTA